MKFTKDEEEFLLENEVYRVAASYNNIPHITPVTYIYEDGSSLAYLSCSYLYCPDGNFFKFCLMSLE